MDYFIMHASIKGKKSTVSFYLESELMNALEDMSSMAAFMFEGEGIPFEDGSVGYFTPDDDFIYLEEKIV